MKSFSTFLILTFFSVTVFSQSLHFPQSWVGNWKGELNWYQGVNPVPKKVNMELRIQPTDSSHKFSWQIIYGSPTQDNRPYTLVAVDTAKGHWVIDENNGIVLDQYMIAGKFCGAFTVQNSTIVNNYWLEEGRLYIEFYNISAKPVTITGKGTEESPSVSSYQVRTYQKAILERSK